MYCMNDKLKDLSLGIIVWLLYVAGGLIKLWVYLNKKIKHR